MQGGNIVAGACNILRLFSVALDIQQDQYRIKAKWNQGSPLKTNAHRDWILDIHLMSS